MRSASRSKAGWCAGLFAALVAFSSSAAWVPAEVTTIPTLPGSGVEMTLKGYFSNNPPGGCVPLQLRIHNGTDRDRSWTLSFTSIGYSLGSTQFRSEGTFQVGAGEDKVFEIEVPMSTRATGAYMASMLTVGARGFGIVDQVLPIKVDTSVGNARILGMSEKVALHNWSILEKSSTVTTLGGGTFDPAVLPTDWRAFVSFGSLWMSEGEWEGLAPQPRAAIRSWVALGGMLVLATEKALPADRPSTRLVSVSGGGGEESAAYRSTAPSPPPPVGPVLPTSETSPTAGGFACPTASFEPADRSVPPAWFAEALGFGFVVRIPWDGTTLSNTAPALMFEAPRSAAWTVSRQDAGGSLASLVAPLEVHSGWVLLFLVAFSLAVGPLNLFLFCRGNKRFHLFWTAPAMSAGATIALASMVLIGDGTGGTGSRWTAMLLLPEDREEVMVQEQIARTGALLSSRFHAADPMLVDPIDLESTVPGARYPRRLELLDRDYGGDWFESRSIQAHFLQAVRPSRARVEIVSGPQDGRGPEIVSSLDTPLEEVYAITDGGRFWHARGVATGARVRLEPAACDDFDRWWKKISIKTGARGKNLLEAAAGRSGWFYASAPGAREAIETLHSISWKQETMVVIGPLAGYGADKGGS